MSTRQQPDIDLTPGALTPGALMLRTNKMLTDKVNQLKLDLDKIKEENNAIKNKLEIYELTKELNSSTGKTKDTYIDQMMKEYGKLKTLNGQLVTTSERLVKSNTSYKDKIDELKKRILDVNVEKLSELKVIYEYSDLFSDILNTEKDKIIKILDSLEKQDKDNFWKKEKDFCFTLSEILYNETTNIEGEPEIREILANLIRLFYLYN